MSRIPPTPRRLLLDHSIVGGSDIGLTIRKDRNLAACRICGAIFQPKYFMHAPDEIFGEFTDANMKRIYDGEREILDWRAEHNKKHTDEEHLRFATSGLLFTPEAAEKLAPFGLVPVSDVTMGNMEVAQALEGAPRAPFNDAETTRKGYI